jgi:hypothetical protein
MSVKEFLKYASEEENLFKTLFISLFTSFAALALFYFIGLKNVENFIPKYGIYLFLAILSYSLILLSARHVRIYKEFACMSGMMIGMTIGMIAGFLSGFFIGATNGMFWGSVFGMAVGILFGVWNGKCCGIMGTMEGMMAGFMGGLMGAMTALMTFNDNVIYMGIITFIIAGSILLGLNYMIYKETREIKEKNSEDNFFIVFWSLLLTAITVWMMVFGPRSALFQ